MLTSRATSLRLRVILGAGDAIKNCEHAEQHVESVEKSVESVESVEAVASRVVSTMHAEALGRFPLCPDLHPRGGLRLHL